MTYVLYDEGRQEAQAYPGPAGFYCERCGADAGDGLVLLFEDLAGLRCCWQCREQGER